MHLVSLMVGQSEIKKKLHWNLMPFVLRLHLVLSISSFSNFLLMSRNLALYLSFSLPLCGSGKLHRESHQDCSIFHLWSCASSLRWRKFWMSERNEGRKSTWCSGRTWPLNTTPGSQRRTCWTVRRHWGPSLIHWKRCVKHASNMPV